MPKKAKSNKKKNNRFGKVVRDMRGAGECWFCNKNIEPDYKNVEEIESFLTPRGNILSRMITGVCAKHQRALSNSIKLARQMALIR